MASQPNPVLPLIRWLASKTLQQTESQSLSPMGIRVQLPKLTSVPFRYAVNAVSYLTAAKRHTRKPVKQAVISASALSLLYP
jgi:hypothetical protein